MVTSSDKRNSAWLEGIFSRSKSPPMIGSWIANQILKNLDEGYVTYGYDD